MNLAPEQAVAREPRTTLRSVAKMARVSAMTVSRALRKHPSVSPKTLARVQKAANALGYRPDPVIAKLMFHLRSQRRPAFQGSICALTDVAPSAHHPYLDKILTGARRRAEQLGFGFSLMHLSEQVTSPKGLHRILRSRGVEGILLLPMDSGEAAVDGLLDWTEFSVLAATGSVSSPIFRRALPAHFANTIELCRRLADRGYRRIGLAFNAEQDSRANHSVSAAVAWHGLREAAHLVPTFVYDETVPTGLAAWFKREKPDVVVVGREDLIPVFTRILGLKIPGKVGFASMNTDLASGITGINEMPVAIGSIAIDTLSGMIQRGEKGVPSVPTSIMVQGSWFGGRSCPKRTGSG